MYQKRLSAEKVEFLSNEKSDINEIMISERPNAVLFYLACKLCKKLVSKNSPEKRKQPYAKMKYHLCVVLIFLCWKKETNIARLLNRLIL